MWRWIDPPEAESPQVCPHCDRVATAYSTDGRERATCGESDRRLGREPAGTGFAALADGRLLEGVLGVGEALAEAEQTEAVADDEDLTNEVVQGSGGDGEQPGGGDGQPDDDDDDGCGDVLRDDVPYLGSC